MLARASKHRFIVCVTYLLLLLTFVAILSRIIRLSRFYDYPYDPQPLASRFVGELKLEAKRVGDSNCFMLRGHMLCLEPQFGDKIHDVFTSYTKAYSNFTKFTAEPPYDSRTACFNSASTKLELDTGTALFGKIPLLLLHIDVCDSLGNMLGSFFEAISFGMTFGFPVGVQYIRRTSSCNEVSGSSDSDSTALFHHLPRLLIPRQYFDNWFGGKKKLGLCRKLPFWPWGSANANMWKNMDVIEFLNTRMVHAYTIAAARQPHSLSNDTLNDAIATSSSTDAATRTPELLHELLLSGEGGAGSNDRVTIHFRCRDNLDHSTMGIIPFKVYDAVLLDILNRHRGLSGAGAVPGPAERHPSPVLPAIITDAAPGTMNWHICGRLLTDLKTRILQLPGFKSVNVTVQRHSVPVDYAYMHQSNYLICAESTFSFFASLGGSHVVYLPKSDHGVVNTQGWGGGNTNNKSTDRSKTVNSKMPKNVVLVPVKPVSLLTCRNCTIDELIQAIET